MPEKEPDIKSLMPLEKYLSILVDSYPEPMRASELAKKTGHSKAAITKIRERLLRLCDTKSMLFEKGFVLHQDFNIIPSLFIVFLANGNHKRFLSSKFFKSLINGKMIHQKISTIFPLYGLHFSEADTTFLVLKIVECIENLPPKDFQVLSKLILSRKPSSSWTLSSLNELQSITKNLKFTFNNKEELLATIHLRDKFFFFAREIIWGLIQGMKILNKQDEKTREQYLSVYKDTADFYLRQIFEKFNDPLLEAGKEFFGKDAESKIRIGASQIMH